MKNLYRYQFAGVDYDEARSSLSVDGQAVHLQARQRKLLSYLLASPGKVIGRDELLDHVWGYNSEAKDHALTTAIDRLRRALGESDAYGIRTVHGRGYQFVGSPSREVVGTEAETSLALGPGDVVPHRPDMRLKQLLGRSASCEVWSARHATRDEQRIYKIGADAQALREIRRESRLLAHVHRMVGAREDITRALSTHLESAPYLIEMEDGGPALDRWAAQSDFFAAHPVEARLELFLQIANAVAALHGAAIIHSDIKPGNILVHRGAEGRPQVRLIDFASGYVVTALLREHVKDLQESLILPGSNDPTRGTYIYFAPELWKSGQPTVQSDVYALGVLLYQLIVGDFDARPDAGWERQIGDALLVEDLSRAVDGDPEQRFGSVQEFARSLQHLEQRREARRAAEEVAEQQAQIEVENQQLRMAKLRIDARRPALAAAFSLLGLALMTTSALWWTVRERNQELIAHRAELGVLNRFLDEDLIGSANPTIVGAKGMTVIDAAVKAASVVDQKYGGEPARARALIHADLQRTLDALTKYEEAVQEGRRALAALGESDAPSVELELRIQVYQAQALIELAQLDAATEALARADVLRQSDGMAETQGAVLYWLERAALLTHQYKFEEAFEPLNKARELASRVDGLPASISDQIDLQLGSVQKMTGKLDVAAATLGALRERQAKRYGAGHPITCYTSMGLAMTLGTQDKLTEAMPMEKAALACLTQALGADDSRTLSALDVLATLYYKADQYAAAAETWNKAIALRLPHVGEQSVRIISARMNVAKCALWQGKYAEAESLLREELGRVRAVRGEADPIVQQMRFELADAVLSQNKRGDAGPLLDGLDPALLGKSALADDWDARLQFESARLALVSGDRAGAREKFEQVRLLLKGKEEDTRIPEKVLAALILKTRS